MVQWPAVARPADKFLDVASLAEPLRGLSLPKSGPIRPNQAQSGHGPCAEEDVSSVPEDIKAHARGGGKAPSVVGLDGEGVELRRLAAGDVVGEILRRARGGTPAAQAEGWSLKTVGDGNLDLAAARQAGDGAGDQIKQQLYLVFGHLPGDAAPDELVLSLSHQATADLLGRAKLDLGAR